MISKKHETVWLKLFISYLSLFSSVIKKYVTMIDSDCPCSIIIDKLSSFYIKYSMFKTKSFLVMRIKNILSMSNKQGQFRPSFLFLYI